MTNKEAWSNISIRIDELMNYRIANGKDPYTDDEIETDVIIYSALKNADEYRWHDIRDSINDFPDGKREVLIECNGFHGVYHKVAVFKNYGKHKFFESLDDTFDLENVLRWRYVDI